MRTSNFVEEVKKKATPLKGSSDLSALIDSIKDKRVVMLGESSHGTKEFYEWRAEISKELILNHGFNFIAVEGDWPPCMEINQFIHDQVQTSAEVTLSHFSRWPSWMWSNRQILNFITWLKQTRKARDLPVNFYGLDVYSLYESMDRVVDLLLKIDRNFALSAATYYSCFDSYRHDEKAYARALFNIPEGCKKHVLKVLDETLKFKLDDQTKHEQLFNAIQNAKIVCNAESYYRAMVLGEEDSWNVRDHHMMETLTTLLDHHGENSKALVWEHNTHIGDYRATDMMLYGQVNIGGLARQALGRENVALVGFSTYSGSVIASSSWDGKVTVMNVPEAKDGSVEALMHKAAESMGTPDFYLQFSPDDLNTALAETLEHRAIGVVYHPPSEHRGNYVPTSLSNRYDAFVFIDKTKALEPIETAIDTEKIPETYPFGAHI